MTGLHFSRLLLKPRARDLYGVHQLLWRAFHDQNGVDANSDPQDDAIDINVARPFLFRADRVAIGAVSTPAWKVLVQANRAADWAHLGDHVIEQTQVGPRSPTFSSGERLRFFVRANATTSKKGRQEQRFAELDATEFREARGVRVAVRSDDDAQQWLSRQGRKHGFSLVAMRVVGGRRERWQRRGNAAVLEGLDIEGHLMVDNVEAFAAVIGTGLGRGRGVGFGLLSVSRERTDDLEA
jgi:CRISPR-associated protein Cas6/Cse3/CasE subtype I-E